MKRNIIVDIDGTMTIVGDRVKYIESEPKEWQKFYDACGEDEVNDPIARLVHAVAIAGEANVVFCTGRSEDHRRVTEEWFADNLGVAGVELIMRPSGDHRSDTIVKPEMLAAAGYTPDNVWFILEDRAKVTRKWRELGFTCLQVANGDF